MPAYENRVPDFVRIVGFILQTYCCMCQFAVPNTETITFMYSPGFTSRLLAIELLYMKSAKQRAAETGCVLSLRPRFSLFPARRARWPQAVLSLTNLRRRRRQWRWETFQPARRTGKRLPSEYASSSADGERSPFASSSQSRSVSASRSFERRQCDRSS